MAYIGFHLTFTLYQLLNNDKVIWQQLVAIIALNIVTISVMGAIINTIRLLSINAQLKRANKIIRQISYFWINSGVALFGLIPAIYLNATSEKIILGLGIILCPFGVVVFMDTISALLKETI
ncbi:hypothetical protein [Pediococcus argentinicus]|nr:hypothetical protein [Pediococcus argentinicus]